jgi:hypothetical protein
MKTIAILKNISNHQKYVTTHPISGDIRVAIIRTILIFANELHSDHLLRIFFVINICSALHIVDFGTTLQNSSKNIIHRSAIKSPDKNLIP